jgi:hypothetical protein
MPATSTPRHRSMLRPTTPSRAVLRRALPAALLACAVLTPAVHAASLSAFAGVVGGSGNGSIPLNCTTYGSPSDTAFFGGFGPGFQVLGGNSTCGYSGGWTTKSSSGSTAPVTNSAALSPTVLGNPGYAESFDGTSKSSAAFGTLSATAHGHLDDTPPSATAGTSIATASAAATFSDTLTAAVPKSYTDLSTAGFVSYRFDVHGTLSTPGVVAAFTGGDALADLRVQNDTGPIYDSFIAQTYTGNVGTLYGAATTGGGWTVGVGLVSGSSEVSSPKIAIDLTKSWNVTAGLIVDAFGNADASFFDTAQLVGIDLFDASGNLITGYTLTSVSGTDYLHPAGPSAVPEPTQTAMLLAGLAAIVGALRRRPPAR